MKKEQLEFIDILLDGMEHLAKKTTRTDYQPSFEEAEKILEIESHAKVILENMLKIAYGNKGENKKWKKKY